MDHVILVNLCKNEEVISNKITVVCLCSIPLKLIKKDSNWKIWEGLIESFNGGSFIMNYWFDHLNVIRINFNWSTLIRRGWCILRGIAALSRGWQSPGKPFLLRKLPRPESPRNCRPPIDRWSSLVAGKPKNQFCWNVYVLLFYLGFWNIDRLQLNHLMKWNLKSS